jgi:NitT/TauT family transport system ATP-binding protein
MTISLASISKKYRSARGDEVTGLSPITLSLEDGAFVSVVGRSGCGKSTLLRLLAGLETPTSGHATIGAETIARPPKNVRYLFQNYGESLLPWKTVGGNIRFGLRHSFGEQPADSDVSVLVESRLEEVGLSGIAERYPAELSGGMQQRVAIARALAANPKVLLLDEPFSAVDALSRATLQDLLLRIWRDHELTIVFVTHDIDEALYLSDRVIVLAPNGGGVQMDVEVALPRPRTQIETRTEPAFLELRRELLGRVLSEH